MQSTIPAARHVRPLTRALASARAAGVPAYAVAEAARVSRSYLSMVASGEILPTAERAERIAAALGCGTAELFPTVVAVTHP